MAEQFRRRSMNRNNVPTPRAEMPVCPNTSCQSAPCQALARRLQMLDFSIADTVIYLDAYPHSEEALAYYHKLLAERTELSRRLSDSCRRPMTCMENTSKDAWHWVDGPWPWDPRAN